MFESGLYLEEAGVLIPWGITATDASSIGSPRVVAEAPRVDVIWGPDSVFDGLKAAIHAVLYGGQKLRRLKIDPVWAREPYDLLEHYEFTRDHLVRALGQPGKTENDPFASMPSYTWTGKRGLRLQLWLFDRFGEQLMLDVGYARKA